MNEKVLLKSEKYGLRKYFIIFILISIIIAIISCIIILTDYYSNLEANKKMYSSRYDTYEDDWKRYHEAKYKYPDDILLSPYISDCYHIQTSHDPSPSIVYKTHPTRESFVECATNYFVDEYIGSILIGPIIMSILFPILTIFLCFAFYKLFVQPTITITDKRILGKGIFGKRIDLPLDKVASIEKFQFMKGILIATASGKIRLFFCQNQKNIYNTLSTLIIERQETKTLTKTSNANELLKYKELLDNGIITQEEFDAKKKQLLGL